MTDARAISAQLVDIRNVGTHKVVKLTLHAPEEHALRIMELFGWPTGVNPVPVALARLVNGKEADNEVKPAAAILPPSPTVSRNTAGEAERRTFSDMKPSQQAGMLCFDASFRRFLNERFNYSTEGAADAAEAVREICNVKSRALITSDNAEWSALVLAYRLWQREPSIIGA